MNVINPLIRDCIVARGTSYTPQSFIAIQDYSAKLAPASGLSGTVADIFNAVQLRPTWQQKGAQAIARAPWVFYSTSAPIPAEKHADQTQPLEVFETSKGSIYQLFKKKVKKFVAIVQPPPISASLWNCNL